MCSMAITFLHVTLGLTVSNDVVQKVFQVKYMYIKLIQSFQPFINTS